MTKPGSGLGLVDAEHPGLVVAAEVLEVTDRRGRDRDLVVEPQLGRRAPAWTGTSSQRRRSPCGSGATWPTRSRSARLRHQLIPKLLSVSPPSSSRTRMYRFAKQPIDRPSSRRKSMPARKAGSTSSRYIRRSSPSVSVQSCPERIRQMLSLARLAARAVHVEHQGVARTARRRPGRREPVARAAPVGVLGDLAAEPGRPSRRHLRVRSLEKSVSNRDTEGRRHSMKKPASPLG